MNYKLPTSLNKSWVGMVAVGILSASAGVCVGYILGSKKNESSESAVDTQLILNFDDQREVAIDVAKQVSKVKTIISAENYARINKDNETELEEDMEEDGYGEDLIIKNVFDHPGDDWDFESEFSTRTREVPYVIHQDEYMANEMEFQQEVLTYYAGDGIMTDIKDEPIMDYKLIIGEDELLFGHGTNNDPNVVYMRNEVIHMEWEILRHSSSFEEEVLGEDIENVYRAKELKHSIQKFRPE